MRGDGDVNVVPRPPSCLGLSVDGGASWAPVTSNLVEVTVSTSISVRRWIRSRTDP